jgi:TRAP-type transport system small permease protein
MATRSAPRGWQQSRVVRVVTGIELGLAAAVTVLMFLLVLLQAAQRYLPIEGFTWTGELARFCLVWLAFVMTGVLVTTDGHIALEMVDLIKNETVLRVIRVFAAATVAVIGAGFAVEAWDLITSSGPLRSPSLRLPMSWFYVLPFIGFVSTAIRAALAAVDIAVHGISAAPTQHVAGAE